MRYKGTCHCGKVAFEAEGTIDGALACNCSICSRKGSLLWFIPRSAFRLLVSPDDVRAYTFNKHVIQHCFCGHCGIHPFGKGVGPDGKEMAAINLRCVEGIDLEAIPVQHFDGKSM